MIANELEPSTLALLTPAPAPAANTGIGAKATLPTTCDLDGSFESEYWNSQCKVKALLPASKSAATAISSDDTALGLVRPSSIVFFIHSNLRPVRPRRCPPCDDASTAAWIVQNGRTQLSIVESEQSS